MIGSIGVETGHAIMSGETVAEYSLVPLKLIIK